MKLLLLVFICLGVSCAQSAGSAPGSLQDIVRNSSLGRKVSFLNPELEGRVPSLSSTGPVQNPRALPFHLLHVLSKREDQQKGAPFMFGDNVNLKWQSWKSSLPTGAVGIYNGYTERTDYICKFKCEAGFYTPSKGPYCQYPYGDKAYYAPEFEVLINIDNFEIVEWMEDSYGSVPLNSIRTCARESVYVGKNKYGLGKVVSHFKAFFLPWEGYEYWYKKYQVLTINRDAYSQHISHVKYDIDKVNLIQYPIEIMRISRSTNNDCKEVVKTVTITKTSEEQSTWNIGFSIKMGATTTITAGIPLIVSGEVVLSTEVSLQFNGGITKVETHSHSLSVELKVPPNHSCTVHMEGRKIKADIHFTARLSRTYLNGETHSTSISGVYNRVQMGELQSLVDRCEPVAGAKPCP